MDPKALFQITYGLYVLSARENDFDNACIINTAVQVANDPVRISISVIKQNKTCEMIRKTGVFNLSAITTEADFALFQRFGFQSGRAADKFQGLSGLKRSENGLYYVTKATNAFISGKVVQTLDYDTHTVFIADVVEAKVLSNVPSLTYAYYFDHVKPKPEPAKQASWVCKVCGYVYEGDPLPADFICPWCKHGAEDFEKQ